MRTKPARKREEAQAMHSQDMDFDSSYRGSNPRSGTSLNRIGAACSVTKLCHAPPARFEPHPTRLGGHAVPS